MVELADTLDLGSSSEMSKGSTPFICIHTFAECMKLYLFIVIMIFGVPFSLNQTWCSYKG